MLFAWFKASIGVVAGAVAGAVGAQEERAKAPEITNKVLIRFIFFIILIGLVPFSNR